MPFHSRAGNALRSILKNLFMIFRPSRRSLAGDLVGNLMEQIKPFEPGFTLGERAETLEKLDDGTFIVTTNKGTQHHAPVVAIAGGLGSFEPRKPPIPNIADFEDKGSFLFYQGSGSVSR